MALRIKELCKEKKITMAEIAAKIPSKDGNVKMGISPVTLSQSLNGNPTLSRLTEVADILGVSVADLFEERSRREVYGCIYVDGKPILVNNEAELRKLVNGLKEEGE